MPKRDEIRHQCRQQRRALNSSQRLDYALQFAQHFSRSKIFKTAKKIACYFPNDGELDLTPLIELAWRHKKQIYLPVLQAPFTARIMFAKYHVNSTLDSNKFGIAEPAVHANQRSKPLQMDIILAPLVAFDNNGNRIGMGGGYYDRSLHFLKHRKYWHKPKLIGCAYDFQEREKIEAEKWDVGLAYICTNNGLIKIA